MKPFQEINVKLFRRNKCETVSGEINRSPLFTVKCNLQIIGNYCIKTSFIIYFFIAKLLPDYNSN